MAVTLTVSQIREVIGRESAEIGNGSPTSTTMGVLFHQLAAQLINPESPCSIQHVFSERDPDLDDWKKALRQQAYDSLLGPILTQRAAALQGTGERVLNLWTAVQQLTDWLADLWWEITEQGNAVPNIKDWFDAEQLVYCELKRKHWPEPVVIVGQPDAVLQVPGKNRLCVLDWKTGRTSPQLDLLQAGLYHLMLQKDLSTSKHSAVAVVSFRPEVSEVIFTSSELTEVRDKLLDVIEKLAFPQPVPLITTPKAPHASKFEPAKLPASRVIEPDAAAKLEAPPKIGPTVSDEWLKKTEATIIGVLKEFDAPVKAFRDPVIGPAFVRFYVSPQQRVTIKKVQGAAEQLQLRLATASPPVVSVSEGAIAIDVPSPNRMPLPFSLLQHHLPKLDPIVGNSRVPVGMDLKGNWIWCDLADSESSHMLVVGTPGSGKSEWLRVALATLLATNTAESLELTLIDPKRNAFTFAQGSNLLRCDILVPGTEPDVRDVLEELVAELELRNQLLADSNSRDLREHILKTGQATKRKIVICDEYAALLDGASKREREGIEQLFKRIAQIGRAPGYHLMLATQQPRANIITPAIRSLLPAKVALRVSDSRESRVAIEENGAERLLGKGDLLYKCIGSQRLQGSYLPTEEESIVKELSTSDIAFASL